MVLQPRGEGRGFVRGCGAADALLRQGCLGRRVGVGLGGECVVALPGLRLGLRERVRQPGVCGALHA